MITNTARSFSLPKPCFVVVLLALWVFQLWAMPANAAGEENPLRPIDTSSPRATLQGFLEFMNEGFGKGVGLLDSYLASSNPYLTPEQMAAIHDAIHLQESAQRSLDLSELPPAIVHEILTPARHTIERSARPHRSPAGRVNPGCADDG